MGCYAHQTPPRGDETVQDLEKENTWIVRLQVIVPRYAYESIKSNTFHTKAG